MKRLLTLLALVLGSVAVILWAAKCLEAKGAVGDLVSSNVHPFPVAASQTRAATSDRVTAEGRIATYPGAEVTVAAETGGVIQRLHVEEQAQVKVGELLAEIKVDEQRLAWSEAKARLAEIDAEIRLAEAELARSQKLLEQAAATQEQLDHARRNYDIAVARRNTTLATVDRLAATVAKSDVWSPIDGVVVQRYVHPGEIAAIGTPLVRIANTNLLRVVAEIDEFDAGRIRLGQSVKITAEGFADQSWGGAIEQIPDAVSEKELKPLDPGRPTDVRVLRVKISLNGPTPLKLGQRVEIDISTQ